ncbi:hypothetical protein VP01_8938g1, partial [Puccinia sorghi]
GQTGPGAPGGSGGCAAGGLRCNGEKEKNRESSFRITKSFSFHKGIVECAWKATAYSHLTLPSHSPSTLHTGMGPSSQLL